MKKGKKIPITFLLIVGVFLNGSQASAKKADTSFQNQPINASQGQTHNERQKMSHTERKAAANRLKQEYEQIRHEDMFNADGKPVGFDPNDYSGLGKLKPVGSHAVKKTKREGGQ